MEHPPWKETKLSLERPYKDHKGDPIPVLLDITQDGTQVFETYVRSFCCIVRLTNPISPQDPTALLGENLRRIIIERGVDFFERLDALRTAGDESIPQPLDTNDDKIELDHREEVVSKAVMTPEELFKMRMDIMPHLLYVVLHPPTLEVSFGSKYRTGRDDTRQGAAFVLTGVHCTD